MVNSNMTTKEILNYAQPQTDLEKLLYERLQQEFDKGDWTLGYINQDGEPETEE